jgi:hypothetical protein
VHFFNVLEKMLQSAGLIAAAPGKIRERSVSSGTRSCCFDKLPILTGLNGLQFWSCWRGMENNEWRAAYLINNRRCPVLLFVRDHFGTIEIFQINHVSLATYSARHRPWRERMKPASEANNPTTERTASRPPSFSVQAPPQSSPTLLMGACTRLRCAGMVLSTLPARVVFVPVDGLAPG